MSQQHVPLEEQSQEDLDKKLRDLQAKTLKVISTVINVNVDTLETLERQIEQTEGDLRMLSEAKENLDQAQREVNKIRLGIFHWGSTEPPSFTLPKQMDNDKDFNVLIDGKKRILRVSVLLYQADEHGKNGQLSIPFNYIQGCYIRRGGSVVDLEFVIEHQKFVGAEKWTVEMVDKNQMYEFVRDIRSRVLAKGVDDFKRREAAGEAVSKKAWAQTVFRLEFEDKMDEFNIEDDVVAINQGMVTALMQDYHRLKKESIKDGKHGKISHGDITDLQSKGVAIISDQMQDVHAGLDHHMELLVQEQQLMIQLTDQANELTVQNQDLLAKNDGCCTMCGCSCTVM